MLKNYIFYIFKYILILFTALFSFASLILIVIGIFIIFTDSIKIDDNDRYLSRIISWYLDKDIKFNSIYIRSINSGSEYYIEIDNIEELKLDNVTSINIKNIRFQFNLVNIFSSNYRFSKIEAYKPEISYTLIQNINDNSTSLQLINNMLSKVDVLSIINGKILLKNDQKIYNISEINIYKKGIENLNITGDFNYKDNFLYKSSKNFKFLSKKVSDNTNINIKFYDMPFPNFILREFNFVNQYSVDMNIYGELTVIIRNNKFLKAEVSFRSDHALIKQNKSYNHTPKLSINIPALSDININLIYEFDVANIIIDKLDYNIINKNGILSNIKIRELLINTNNNELSGKIDFSNFIIKEFYKTKLSQPIDFISIPLSGQGFVKLINNKIDILNLSINDTNYKNLNMSEINLFLNNKLDNRITFNLKGHTNDIKEFIINYNLLNFKDLNNYNFDAIAELKIKIDIQNNIYKLSNLNTYIAGSIDFIYSSVFYFNKEYFIDKINFKAFLSDAETTINGKALVNNNIFKFEYIKLKNSESSLLIDFNLNHELINNQYFSSNIIGKIPTICLFKFYSGNIKYTCELNLSLSSISIPEINYNKGKSENAFLTVEGLLSNDYDLDSLNFNFSNLKNSAKGEFEYDKFNNSYLINFDELIYKFNDLTGDINFHSNNNININIFTGTLDLRDFKLSDNHSLSSININVKAKLDKLIVLNDIYFNKSKLFYSSNNLSNKLTISSGYFTNEVISFSLNSTKDNDILAYDFNASNAGKFFELLNYKTEIKDGVLSSQGFIGGLDNNNNDIMGTVSIDDFKIMKAPLFAELLLAASLTGIFDVLNNDGIEFEQFDAQFIGKDNIYKIIKSRAYGFSIGLTGKGNINFDNNMMDISGSIVPAYKLNSLFNNIPLIGELLSGKEDEGIIAINYNSKGILSDPEITINPFSVLTPGILRNILDF